MPYMVTFTSIFPPFMLAYIIYIYTIHTDPSWDMGCCGIVAWCFGPKKWVLFGMVPKDKETCFFSRQLTLRTDVHQTIFPQFSRFSDSFPHVLIFSEIVHLFNIFSKFCLDFPIYFCQPRLRKSSEKLGPRRPGADAQPGPSSNGHEPMDGFFLWGSQGQPNCLS